MKLHLLLNNKPLQINYYFLEFNLYLKSKNVIKPSPSKYC